MKYIIFTLSFFLINHFSLAQVTYDDPCNAQSMNVTTMCNYIETTNVNSTPTMGIMSPGCANYYGADVWFSFEVPSDGGVSINSMPGSLIDGGMAVYTGDCSSLTMVECNDDDSENGEMPKLYIQGLTPGETAYIRFWGYGGQTGTFSLCITKMPSCGNSPPAGNTCAEATPICDFNGYCGSTSSSYSVDSWGEAGLGIFSPATGLHAPFCGSIENNSFLKFEAAETSISFDLWVLSTSNDYGIQLMIFQPEQCGSGDVVGYGDCYSPGEVEPGAVSITATGLTEGETYYIMIDGNSGDVCDYMISANSGFNVALDVQPENATICQGEQIELTAFGGDGTYTWDAHPDLNATTGAVVIATPSSPGTYNFTVNSSEGNVLCPSPNSVTASVTVEDCGGVSCSVTTSNSGPICASSEMVNLFSSEIENATYTWSGPNGFTSSDQNPVGVNVPSSPGDYTYTITVDSLGTICSSSTVVTIHSLPVVNAGTYNGLCTTDSTIPLTGSPTGGTFSGVGVSGNSFTPSVGSQTITYSYINANGCENSDSVFIEVEECTEPCAVSASNSGPVCVDAGTIDLFVTTVQEASYLWSGPNNFSSTVQNPQGVVPPSSGGNYTYTVQVDSAGVLCSTSTEVIIHSLPTVEAGEYLVQCDDGPPLDLTGSPLGGTFSGTGVTGSTFDPSLGTQTLTYSYTDANGCTSSDQVNIEVSPCLLECNLSASNTGPTCEGGGNFNLEVSGMIGGTYSWTGPEGFNSSEQNPQSVVAPTLPGSYTYTVVADFGNGDTCSTTTTLVVNTIPQVSFTADVLSGCAPLTVNFLSESASTNPTCEWNFGDQNTSNNCYNSQHTYEETGCYDVSLTVTENGCTNSYSIADFICITAPAEASFIVSPLSNSLENSEFEFFNQSSNASSFEWDFGDGQTSNEYDPTHNYSGLSANYNVCLVAQNDLGCNDTTCRLIKIEEQVIFYVPNAFTPDGDEFNQLFRPIFTSGYDPYDFNFKIFNRWGQLIWESNNPTAGWDGTYGGQIVKDGSYVWQVEFKTNLNDERRVHKGHLTLVR